MYFPGMPLQPLVIFNELSNYLNELENLEPIQGGVGVYGAAAAYALVWELGSLRLKQPGPKTMWGTNRNNEIRIMSKQAPGGYVGILEDSFWPIIQEELNSVDFTKGDLQLRMEVAIDNAGQKIAELIRQWAPVDSGELRSDILGVGSDEVSFLSQSQSIESQSVILL
jgi:hypothetical protein